MKKFFLYDTDKQAMVEPISVPEKNGQMKLTLNGSSSILTGAYLYTNESLKEMGIRKTDTMVELPVTQKWLDMFSKENKNAYIDTAPNVSAEDRPFIAVPLLKIYDDQPIILAESAGMAELTLNEDSGCHYTFDMANAVSYTYAQLEELGAAKEVSKLLKSQEIIALPSSPEVFETFFTETHVPLDSLPFDEEELQKFIVHDGHFASEEPEDGEEPEDDVDRDPFDQRKFFIYNSQTGELARPEAIVFNPEARKWHIDLSLNNIRDWWRNSSLIDGTLFTPDTLSEIQTRFPGSLPFTLDNIDFGEEFSPVFVNQPYLDDIEFSVNDLNECYNATPKVPRTSEKDLVVGITPMGVVGKDGFGNYQIWRTHDMVHATRIPKQDILSDPVRAAKLNALGVVWTGVDDGMVLCLDKTPDAFARAIEELSAKVAEEKLQQRPCKPQWLEKPKESDIPGLKKPNMPEPDLPEPDLPEPNMPEPDLPEPDLPELDLPELDLPELEGGPQMMF